MRRWLSNEVRWMGLVAVALMAAGTLGGCGSRMKTQRDALYARNQEQQNRLADTETALEQAEAERMRLANQNKELNEQLASQPDNAFNEIEGVDVEQSRGQIAVRVPGDVLFAPGKAELQSEVKKTLQEVAQVIEQQYPDQLIRVEGHTDTDPIRQSKWRDNLQLSIARAAAVERFLESQGISSQRMFSSGFGASQPRETKAQSRRVEIVVTSRSAPSGGAAQSGGGSQSGGAAGPGSSGRPSSPSSSPAEGGSPPPPAPQGQQGQGGPPRGAPNSLPPQFEK